MNATATAIAISLIAILIALSTRKDNMDAIERLSNLVTKLNETITSETAQQKAVIQELRDSINSGANAEKLNQIADDLEASIGRVAAIVPDEAPVEAPAEPAPVDATPSDDSATDVTADEPATGTEG